MTITRIEDVEFGAELPTFEPDTSLDRVRAFAAAVGWGGPRFDDHERARAEGLPGALVPGIMSMGFITTMIHEWSPRARVEYIDTVFRAPLLADEPCTLSAVVTDVDEASGVIELDVSVKNAAGETRVFGNARVSLEPSVR
jgi:acyl dehydratase